MHRSVLVLATAAFAVVALARAADEPAKPVEFASKDHKFKATFPEKPKVQEQKAMDITFFTYSTQTKNGAYMVGVSDLPLPDNETDEKIQERLDGARDGAINNVGGKQTSSKAIKLGKYPGREFTASLEKPEKGLIRARVYLVGKRFYQVMVIGGEEYANSKEATAFLDSFKLTE